MLEVFKTLKTISITGFICCGISAFAVQPANTINILDYGVANDGSSDCSTAIQTAIDNASSNSEIVGVYFPVGTYKVANKIYFKNGASLYGEDSGVSLLKADSPVAIGAHDGGSPAVNNVNLEDLFFKNVFVSNYSWVTNRRHNLDIRRCVFSATSDVFKPDSSLVGYSRVDSGIVEDNIFLRQSQSPGIGFSSWKCYGLTFRRNIVGLNLRDTEWISQWPGAANWNNLRTRLESFKVAENLEDNQGHYRKGFDASSFQNARENILTIEQNIFNGTEEISTWKDHVLYIHNNRNKIVMIQNWMRGWGNTPNGGLKIRNNFGPFIIAANRFKNTPIYGYIHRTDAIGIEGMEVYIGTFVYRNIFDFSIDNPCYGGIGFWDQASEKGGLGVEENNEYAENILNTPNNTAQFWFRSGDPSGHTIYASNYHKDGTLVEASSSAFELAIGAPSTEKTAPYASLVVPEYDIPHYDEDLLDRIAITEDAHVHGGSYGNNNYNGEKMIVKNYGFNGRWDRRILFKADFSSVLDIDAYEHIYLNFRTAENASSSDTITAHFYGDNSWSESTITYNNTQDVTTPALDSVTNLTTETWYQLDITEAVKEQVRNGNWTITIMLKATDGSFNKIYSKESQFQPYIDFE